VLDVIGEVKGATAIIVDDFVVSGGTLVEIAKKLVEKGARRILAAVTHGVFAQGSAARIDDSPIERILVTNTVENHPVPLSRKVEFVSAAACFGEAIRRIHGRESISEMFP
jgi:ribose-phosphate pyrophosphokinase